MINYIFKFYTRIWYCCECPKDDFFTPCVCIGTDCPDSCIYKSEIQESCWKQLTTIKTLYKLIKSFKGSIIW